jgi:hypothetical protein
MVKLAELVMVGEQCCQLHVIVLIGDEIQRIVLLSGRNIQIGIPELIDQFQRQVFIQPVVIGINVLNYYSQMLMVAHHT